MGQIKKQAFQSNLERLIKFLHASDETFADLHSSIRVQPIIGLRKARLKVRTPRWQPRGRDTSSFRPLVQEEVVSSSGRVLVPRPRVNSVSRASSLSG